MSVKDVANYCQVRAIRLAAGSGLDAKRSAPPQDVVGTPHPMLAFVTWCDVPTSVVYVTTDAKVHRSLMSGCRQAAAARRELLA